MPLKVLSSFYRGAFEDAHFYMGYFVLVNTDKSLSFINLERCCNIYEYKYRATSPLTTIFFARNDWLNSALFKKMYANATFQKSFNSLMREAEKEWFDLFSGGAIERQISLKLQDEILETKPYSRHLYLGTISGFYDCILDWEGLEVSSFEKRHDGQVLFINPAFGTVNVSGGEDGLFSSIHELGNENFEIQSMELVDDKSTRSNWSHSNLLNYPSNKSVSILPTEVKSIRDVGKFENKLVTRIVSQSKKNLMDVISEIPDGLPKQDEIQFVFNGRENIFINTYAGKLKSIGIAQESDRYFVKYEKEFSGPSGRIISVNAFLHGFLIETEEKILLFHKGRFEILHSGRAINIRTFPASKRYKNIVLIVSEKGVHIYSIFDEDLLAT